jgi:hypothetical protein
MPVLAVSAPRGSTDICIVLATCTFAVVKLATAESNVVTAFNGVVKEVAATPEAGRVEPDCCLTVQTYAISAVNPGTVPVVAAMPVTTKLTVAPVVGTQSILYLSMTLPVPGIVLPAVTATQLTWMLVELAADAVTEVGNVAAPAHGLADVATIMAISPRAKIPSIQRIGTMDPADPSIGYLLRSARLLDQNANTVFAMAPRVVKRHSRNRYFEC